MLLFNNHNFAYLHINKTGGSTTKDYLRKVIPEEPEIIGLGNRASGLPRIHEVIGDKKQRLGDRFNELRVLTTVRNPFDRWVSLYTAAVRNFKEKRKNYLVYRSVMAAELPFDEWLLAVAFREGSPQTLPISRFIFMRSFYVDRPFIPDNLHIIRLEDMNDALPKFLRNELSIETDLEIPHKNKSSYMRDKDTMDYYPDHLRKIVYDLDKYIIDKYYPEFKYKG